MRAKWNARLISLVLAIACSCAVASEPRTIDWVDLVPAEARDRPPPPPPTIHDFLMGETGPAPVLQTGDLEVNRELDGVVIRIPGYVVPLELDPSGLVTELFLVPYFGACIHVPPPPPNQLVFVRIERGMKVDSMYGAYWLTGRLSVKSRNTHLGSAAYTLVATEYEEYDY